ncbi:MAG: GNAT family N-acetyltransferase, partial [Candidatus Omnitrophica bacterium]|nr:GNAT family N-acetyltransferase [Candidatus Omnitrophota bacterium]
MSLEIRKINQNDRETFVELSLALTKFNRRQHDKHYADFQEFLRVRKHRAEETFDKIDQSPHKLIMMAFKDDKPVGYLRAFTYDKKLRRGCLDELFLTEDARGQGISKKLLDAATQWMEEQNVIRMITSV